MRPQGVSSSSSLHVSALESSFAAFSDSVEESSDSSSSGIFFGGCDRGFLIGFLIGMVDLTALDEVEVVWWGGEGKGKQQIDSPVVRCGGLSELWGIMLEERKGKEK